MSGPHDQNRLEQYRSLAAQGMTVSEVAIQTGVKVGTVIAFARRHGVKFQHAAKKAHNDDRVDAISSMYRAGKTLQEIGDVFGITRERVRQLLRKYTTILASDGGSAKKAADAAKRRAERAERKCFEQHGCSRKQLAYLRALGRKHIKAGGTLATTPTIAFTQQRSNALRRGLEWRLKLWEWWTIWQESGHWHERGRAGDKYVMCRFADAGAYEIGNVYIATLAHNSTVQLNNPYRNGHPDHEKVWAARAKQNRPRPGTRQGRHTKNIGLPHGVTRHKNGAYIAQIGINGRCKYLGCFKTPELAAAAYQRALNEIEVAA